LQVRTLPGVLQSIFEINILSTLPALFS